MKQIPDGWFIGLFVTTCFGLVAASSPDRPPPKKVPRVEVPKIGDFESNWGTVTQEGRKLFIGGGAVWVAEGHILQNGRVVLTWTYLRDGREAPSVYEWDGKQLNGKWGYADEVKVSESGVITGRLMEDTIWRIRRDEPCRWWSVRGMFVAG